MAKYPAHVERELLEGMKKLRARVSEFDEFHDERDKRIIEDMDRMIADEERILNG